MITLSNENLNTIKSFKKRKEYIELKEYIDSNSEKVLILSGLRRTGKTVMLNQLFSEIGKENAELILIENSDSMKDIQYFIDNSEKNIFIFDEITKIDDIDSMSILYDKYTKYGKKIIISGTESLIFEILKDYTLYDRTETIRLLPLSFKEYKRLTNKDYEEYIESCGIFSENKNIITDISNNIIKSLEKLDEVSTYDNKLVETIIKIIFLKIVWTEELHNFMKFLPFGIKREDIVEINELIVKNLIKSDINIEYTRYRELEEIYQLLLKLEIIKEYTPIKDNSKIKKIIPIPGIITKIYKEIEEYCKTNKIFYSKKLMYGLIFEKEMNVQSYLTNNQIVRYTLDTNSIEIDEIIEYENKVFAIDYKSSDNLELIKTRLNMQNIEKIIDILRIKLNKGVEYIIVYNGETKDDIVKFINNHEFLQEIENKTSKEKFGDMKWI